ncbi:prolipoprotein diacylglyceryl transferase [Chloroflexi bacterium TSY]|nr:prolipoprotein diacylglyceryl transferase [Chloroflexi bacterium TSY]
MYTTIALGPLSLPTGPILMILAAVLGLEVMARYGQRNGMSQDELWNVGLIALTGGLIVARLWNVVQFWMVYQAEPLLILSIRPSGFALWPGISAGVLFGYGYMIYKAHSPELVLSAAGIGLIAAGIVMSVAAYLTGQVIGTESTQPWAMTYYGELLHPVALYRALGYLLLLGLLWFSTRQLSATSVILVTLVGYSLVRLISDAFVADAPSISGIRTSQIIMLVIALLACGILARRFSTV